MITTGEFISCLFLAAQTYQVPPAVLLGIMSVEGGRIGQEAGPNSNGSYDLGPMQINTLWLPKLAKHWQVDQPTARSWVRDNACVNVHVAAWILRDRINQNNGVLLDGIAEYHSATPHLGRRYAEKVLVAIKRMAVRSAAAQQQGRTTRSDG